MIPRLIKVPANYSYFLFGPRGCGKSTFLRHRYPPDKHFWVDLIDKRQRQLYADDPMQLRDDWQSDATPEQRRNNLIIIDEIQIVPDLLDTVQLCIDRYNINFIMTGSSARKLRYGAANLLAARAFFYNLHPFSARELGEQFDLDDALQFGLLPRSVALRDDIEQRKVFLDDYVSVYLREEIIAEQLVNDLEPFRDFLKVAAASSGMIINTKNIAKQTNIDHLTVGKYFQWLNDTLLGFYLPGYSRSARSTQATNPKFYFFDTGIMRAACRVIRDDLTAGNYTYVRLFEHIVILEIVKADSDGKKMLNFSYLKTSNGKDSEIDLIVRQGESRTMAIEIKSATSISSAFVKKYAKLCRSIENCEPYIFCRVEQAYEEEGVKIMPWLQGVKELFT